MNTQNLEASIHARLLNIAQTNHRPFAELWRASKRRTQLAEDVPELVVMLQVLRPFLTLNHMPDHHWRHGQWRPSV